jgi:hypothetical protein
MKKNIAFLIMSFAIVVGISALAPAVTAESNFDKPDADKKEIQEFSEASVLQSSSTTSVCHVPKGNPNNTYEIIVSTSSLTAHLTHGDYQGIC